MAGSSTYLQCLHVSGRIFVSEQRRTGVISPAKLLTARAQHVHYTVAQETDRDPFHFHNDRNL